MMKQIIVVLISLLISACGSRSKMLSKTLTKSDFKQNSEIKTNTSVLSQSNSITDLRNYLINNNLKIKSTGQNYEIKYGDFIFSGSADLEFTEKKEETEIHHKYYNHVTYMTYTKYQTKTNYQTQKTLKDLNVSRDGISFGSVVWIVITSLIIGATTSQLIRLYIKK